MLFLRRKTWWPVSVGILFALIEVASFYISKRPLGASRGYTVIGSILEYVIWPKHAAKVTYWQSYEPYVEWTMAMLVGIVLGSFVSSVLSGEFRLRFIPEMWKVSKGPSIWKRWYWAFIGGILVGFGARMAMGCTLGMLIAGVIQLSPAGFIFMMSLWMGGANMTVLFYRLKTLALIKRD